jgi:ABC-2 type transport system ATP-binding protein
MDAPPSSPERAAIWTEGLGKLYRSDFWKKPVVGLTGLDLCVERGQIFGFVGPNGAGKTTTIKVLMGMHKADSGRAYVMGMPHTDPESRRRVGFLPERPYFYEHLTARELLHFYGELLGMGKAERVRQMEPLLERVELQRFADVPLGRYSKGMLQRVGLCQALLHDPELLVLDEPMSGLDPLGRALVRDLIAEEGKRGRTVFFSSHILHDIETLCDRVAIVVGGKLRGQGTVAELIGHRVRYVDVTVEGSQAVELPGEAVRVEGETRVLRLPPEAVDAALRRAIQQGLRVLEVTPIRETLEDVLLDEVERARPVKADTVGVLS